MSVQVTTILRPRNGKLQDAVRFCKESAKVTGAAGGKTRLYSALAAGRGTGELVAVTEFENMEQYGKMIDKGPPKEIIEQIRSGDSSPVELVSMNLGVEIPETV